MRSTIIGIYLSIPRDIYFNGIQTLILYCQNKLTQLRCLRNA